MQDLDLEYVDMLLDDIKGRLHGLPFTVVDRSGSIGTPFFDIYRVFDGDVKDAIGFIAKASVTDDWYGRFFGESSLSDPYETMMPALSWLVNQHLNHIRGV